MKYEGCVTGLKLTLLAIIKISLRIFQAIDNFIYFYNITLRNYQMQNSKKRMAK